MTAVSISLAAEVSEAVEDVDDTEEEEGGSCRILLTWSLLVSTVLWTERKES